MSYYLRRGAVPPKRHTQFRQPDGSLYHEEVMDLHGFAGIQSLLYHLRPPTAIERVLDAGADDVRYEPPGPLRHRLLPTAGLPPAGDAVGGRVTLMANADLRVSVVRPAEPMAWWYRHADGDELIFVHEGAGVVESQFGSLRYRPRDYLVLPTGVLWRLLPDTGSAQRMLVVSAAGGHIEAPARYRNRHGQFVESAPWTERDIRPPDPLETHDQAGEFEVRVGARGRVTRCFHAHHPLDVVGWDGHLWPYAFSIDDFEPITGRVHQPPPAHQTFEGPGFVVCSFVPRLADYHPLAIPSPYNHSNVDSDEVIYYVDGDFLSRPGVEAGAFTVHPNGIPHGPQPGAYEGSIGRARTDELAVMIDTFRPLRLTARAAALEDETYARAWSTARRDPAVARKSIDRPDLADRLRRGPAGAQEEGGTR